MCESCWHELGAPAVSNEKVRAAARMIGDADWSLSMHLFIDDWNVDDKSLAAPQAVASRCAL